MERGRQRTKWIECPPLGRHGVAAPPLMAKGCVRSPDGCGRIRRTAFGHQSLVERDVTPLVEPWLEVVVRTL